MDRAFDNVPHACLFAALVRAGVDTCLARYVSRWLRGRISCLLLCSPLGVFYSRRCPHSRGHPHGGALSLFLWLMHIGPAHGRLDVLSAHRQSHKRGLGRVVRLYADDVAVALSHRDPRCPVEATGIQGGNTNMAFDVREMCSNVGKSGCLAFSPPNVTGRFSAKAGGGDAGYGKNRRGDCPPARTDVFGPDKWRGGLAAGAMERLFEFPPYAAESAVKVSGITFGAGLSFENQISTILVRAKGRLAALT